MSDNLIRQIFQVSLSILFSFVLCVALFGIFWQTNHTAAFVTIAVITSGMLLMVAPSRATRFIIGPKGVEAQLDAVRQIIEDQQKIINQLVIFSLAEIIYRELLWKITNNIEVECDKTADQRRWLTFLFDHGLLKPRDMTRWLAFDEIPRGQNLSEIFEATPAAKYLVELRREPRPAPA
jgi:hypothetical protein